MPKIDVIPLNTKINSLTILAERPKINGVRRIFCLCDCGKYQEMDWQNVKHGRTSTCGCQKHMWKSTHGDTKTILYSRWEGMKQRCYNQSMKAYPSYGGRGISMCDTWKNSYEAFKEWAIAVGFVPQLTLERKDTNGDYTPENCVWTDRYSQQANRRKIPNTAFKYIGVHQIKNTCKWRAMICVKHIKVHLGIFDTESEAVAARDLYIKDNNLPHMLNII